MYHHKTGITLRKLEQSDLGLLLQMKNESWCGTHQTLIANLDDQQKWYENLPSNTLIMTICSDSTVLGVCCITNIDHLSRMCSISGTILKAARAAHAKNAWFCGMDFAFEILNMYRVEAEVLACNYVGQVFDIQHVKMKVEGLRRQAVYKSGHYYDSILLGLLRSEWETSERVKGYNGSCNFDFDPIQAEKMIQRSQREILDGKNTCDGGCGVHWESPSRVAIN